MNVLQRLLERLGLRQPETLRQYQFDAQVHAQIEELARQSRVPEREVTTDLLASALNERQVSRDLLLRWRSLSYREQQVTALACLGYTNREIAARLGIALSTIKTHLKHIMVKFNMQRKTDLLFALRGWDFSEWDRPPWRGG